jgi:hypothetical protein
VNQKLFTNSFSVYYKTFGAIGSKPNDFANDAIARNFHRGEVTFSRNRSRERTSKRARARGH